MTQTKQKAQRPKPTEKLSGESRAEWDRIVRELESVGRIHKVDRALLTLYVNTWAAHQAAAKTVRDDGFETVYSNGNKGVTPAYNVMKETAKQLRTLLNDMGITPVQRGGGDVEQDDGDLKF